MEAYFDNKNNVLNAHIRTSYDDSVLYTVKSTSGFRGPRITILEDANPVLGQGSNRIVGAIHWKEKVFEVNGHRKPLAEIKRREGRIMHTTRYWRWGKERKEYEIRFDDDEWKATTDHGMSISARFEVSLRPHLFGKSKPPKFHLTTDTLEADEVFMILAFIYCEVKRQNRTNSGPTEGISAW
ncbi:hypothetical protein PC9H_002633 [Pleurotus ostreatus]|uniref:DUF6593 domain-containing protein n=3 Tax=Pleurotus TaxID=5320 RepID=A0A067N4Z7_PLEO1|nr:uncharacterized protein PC9H_002633 [Pleurotus ostreatus]KAF7416368.1 hypothetical protein PC9H_002633 [Pleurotus ostreatus]KAG9225374.1 hypothetical protein CCMSSC00406_0006239 [Pleurotus cornucopiae]KAJ8689265.1 hypothetical protein PTI98_013306 [Pleurotus ostreatus]KDQ22894.1 hypothetical protein PLEOSDRAFT_1060260 [Pleurotus ostreatus PC15]